MGTLHALVNDQGQVDRYSSSVDAQTGTESGWRWLPVVDTNPVTLPGQVSEGPTVTVGPDQVSRIWTVRDKTAQELDDEKTAVVDRLVVEAVGKVLFNHENRIRALNSQAPVTADQFKTAVKAML